MIGFLLSLAIAMLMVGCGESSQPSESTEMNSTAPESPNPSGVVDMTDTAPKKDAIETAVDWSKLEDRGGVMYLPNEETPFTGRAEIFYENGQKKGEETYKVGKLDGLRTGWYENGQKMGEGNFKDGIAHGLWTKWYENGLKKREGNFKDGERHGLWTSWYENGQKTRERNYKDGKLMSAESWKPNGEKCPVTNVKDGTGVKVLYKQDGTELERWTYKDGERVFD